MTETTDDATPRCRHCDESVADEPNRRVVTSVEDGTAVYYHFCDDDCLEAWES
ncbi:DUF7576 family protein [Halopiger goleimassiliensis]|uniref:DUF7576 family protein n=1 Tax=Halopiger goleimassiliensis TaxID=1293048 RepID=UPI000B227377|nr:hypothetical protein [Halopiger goleimassiliensis]